MHLQHIENQSYAQTIPKGQMIWHYIWGKVFHFLHIDVNKIFLRAYIIHFTQTIISFVILYYFSKVSIRILFTKINSIDLKYLAYWSTLIWFTILSTVSQGHQQVWILWYSINYQISLPFTLLITALSLSLVVESSSLKRKAMFIMLIVLFSYIILRIHAMEYIYYLMYMGILILVFLDKIFIWWKKYIYYTTPLIFIMIFIFIKFIPYIKTIASRSSDIFNYLSFEKLPQLLTKINSKGELILNHYNKSDTTLNALIYLSLGLVTIILLISIYRHYKKFPSYINLRMVIFLFITSFFIIIPLTKITAGFASVLTYDRVTYRFYFSSLVFLVVPSFIFYIFNIFHKTKTYILNLSIVLLLLSTFLYSKYISTSKNYYKNIISVKNAFIEDKMRFNLSDKNIKTVGKKLQYYESLNNTKKPIYYYARDDIAFVIKFIYRKPVKYYRRGSKNYKKSFTDHKNKKYYPVLFEVPNNFPSYQRYK